MAGVTYDTGALIAAERNDRRMWALHAGLLAEEVAPVVPAPVLAKAWRGGSRQANMARLLAMCDVEWMTEDQARTVGVLAGHSGHDDIVNVTVVGGAIRRDTRTGGAGRGHRGVIGTVTAQRGDAPSTQGDHRLAMYRSRSTSASSRISSIRCLTASPMLTNPAS